MANKKRQLTQEQKEDLLAILKTRFEKNSARHTGLEWRNVVTKLEENPDKLWSLNEMEKSGGEPDVTAYDVKTNEYTFMDCAVESPIGRRNTCYDKAALDARKEFKPKNSAVEMAEEMGLELLTEAQYRELQKLGDFDAKTSSWVQTPADIRKKGGALFCDFRYGSVFLYHNGASSYYAARGFRCALSV